MSSQELSLRLKWAHDSPIYESNFKNVLQQIDQAVQRARTTDKKYQKVHVLSLRWSNDDMGLASIEADLLQVFQDIYNFTAETYLISHTNPNFAVETALKMIDVVLKNQGTQSLLIIFYEGHASRSTANPESLSIFGSLAHDAPVINWDTSIMGMVDAFTGDTLVIMDYCEATTAPMRRSEHEYLYSSASKSSTNAIGYSFTQRIIDLLKSNNGDELSIAQIHAKLIQNPGDWNIFLDNSLVHVAPRSKPSVTLRPLNKEGQERHASKLDDTNVAGKFLISVRLQGKNSIEDIKQWQKWLVQSIPETVPKIKIQAVFDSEPTLCLLTVPIEIWDMLPDHDSYTFINFVSSDNKCPV